MRAIAAAIAAALLCVAPLHPLHAEEDRPFLTLRWLPLTLPMQLVAHELSHAAVGTAFGWKVSGFDFMADGHIGVTRFSNQSNGFPLFAVAVAPRLLDILQMIIFSKLHDGSTDDAARGFYNAVRLSAWMDFEFNTCKTFLPHHHAEPLYYGAPLPKGMTGNDGWDTADGLGLSDGNARAASAVLAIGIGYIGLRWIF
jgi:hypothetical protein